MLKYAHVTRYSSADKASLPGVLCRTNSLSSGNELFSESCSSSCYSRSSSRRQCLRDDSDSLDSSRSTSSSFEDNAFHSSSSTKSSSDFENGSKETALYAKIYVRCLLQDLEYTTIALGQSTTSRQVVNTLFSKFKTKHRDASLFYLTMEVTAKKAGSSMTMCLILEDDAFPAQLLSCHPTPNSRLVLKAKPGVLLRVYDGAIATGVRKSDGVERVLGPVESPISAIYKNKFKDTGRLVARKKDNACLEGSQVAKCVFKDENPPCGDEATVEKCQSKDTANKEMVSMNSSSCVVNGHACPSLQVSSTCTSTNINLTQPSTDSLSTNSTLSSNLVTLLLKNTTNTITVMCPKGTILDSFSDHCNATFGSANVVSFGKSPSLALCNTASSIDRITQKDKAKLRARRKLPSPRLFQNFANTQEEVEEEEDEDRAPRLLPARPSKSLVSKVSVDLCNNNRISYNDYENYFYI